MGDETVHDLLDDPTENPGTVTTRIEDGTCVVEIDFDDGPTEQIEHQISKPERTVARGFVERHDNLHSYRLGIGGYYAEYDINRNSPGQSNIGSKRSDAESWASRHGYDVEVEMFEEGADDDRSSSDLLVKFDLHER